MMKVLLINECHCRHGGADIVYLNEGQLLEDNGVDVMYYTPITPNMEPCKYSSFFYASAKNSFQKLGDSFYNIRARKGLKRLLKEEKPDIVHLHCFLGYESSSIYSVIKKYNIPIVHTVHDYRMVCPANHFLDKNNQTCELCRGGRYYQCLFRRCSKGHLITSLMLTLGVYFRNLFFNPIKHIDGFIFVSHFSQNKHIEHNPKFKLTKSVVLYNSAPGYDQTSSEEGNYILYFGRLSAEKGVDTLIKAFLSMSDIPLKIVGNGPLYNTFLAQVEDANAKNIELLGYKTGEELHQLIIKSKYVIVPSVCYENNPMSVVEAFSFSKPVLGASSGAIPEFVIEGETGFLFEKANVEDLIRVVIKAYSLGGDLYRHMKEEAHTFYENNFSEKQHIKNLINFYSEIITNKDE